MVDMTHAIRVLGPFEGEVQLIIEAGSAFRPNDSGADACLTVAEVKFLRDSLTLALRELDADTSIMSSPHTLVRDARGVASWRPVLTSLSVYGVAQDHNARHLVIREDGVERYRFKLSAEDAQHLAGLLGASGAPAPSEASAEAAA